MKEQMDYYNRLAKDYDRKTFFHRKNRNHLKKIRKIIDLLDIKKGDMVLEVGVGTGIHAEYLKGDKGIVPVGVDISRGMIEESRKRLGNDFTGIVADGNSLPFEDNSFDAVYCSTTLHHLNPARGFAEMVRVLKPGKSLVVMEPNIFFPKNFLQALLIKRERNNFKVTLENLKKWAKRNNLENLKTGYFIFTPPWPKSLFNVYDKIDELLARTPFLCLFSIMIFLSGRKGV